MLHITARFHVMNAAADHSTSLLIPLQFSYFYLIILRLKKEKEKDLCSKTKKRKDQDLREILELLYFFPFSIFSIQAGRSNTTKRNHNPSVGQLQYYKNHHESVTVEKMSVFDKFRRGSSKVRRKIVGNEEEKRFIPAGPNPLHNK
ncbi:hypothetical protein HID58_032263 [Brassica napus]|uniref:Uncharacterized protein n=1 Tax=Brassica napus TaxID=3708 RepID=A0ABQ8BVV3_BRANA|nr:hypothetical protein HID58_032263 [Brassica napus]